MSIGAEKEIFVKINPRAAFLDILGDDYPVQVGSVNERKGYGRKADEFDENNSELIGEIKERVLTDGLSTSQREDFEQRRSMLNEDGEAQFGEYVVDGIPIVGSRLPVEENAPTELSYEENAPTERIEELKEERKKMYSRVFTMAVLKWIEIQEPGKKLVVPKFRLKDGVKDGKFERVKKVITETSPEGKKKDIEVDDTDEIEITDNFWEKLLIEENSEIIFRQLTEKFLERLIVHGKAEKLEDGTVRIKQKSDKDGMLCEKYLKLAGVTGLPVEYVGHEHEQAGVVFADMGNKDGVYYVVEQDLLGEWVVTVYFDHHDSESSGDSSASGIMFETLAALGMFEEPELYEKLLSTRKG
jgi:hypothetical protein